MFYDLNLPYPVQPNLAHQQTEFHKRIDLLIKFGYQVVAYNHIITGKLDKANPIRKLETYNISPDSPSGQQKIEQLSRVTVVIEDASQNYGLSSTNSIISSYDIVAAQPTNEKIFQNICGTLEVDIISLEMGSRLPFYIKHGPVGLAIERGVYFEICYAPAIRDSASRRQLISNAQSLVRVTRGKNIIISSEAQKAMELRGPYDIVNLGTIMGMNQATAKDCVSTNCRAVVMHAKTRRNTHRAVVSFEPISSLKPNELWKVGSSEKNTRKTDSKGKSKAKRIRLDKDYEEEENEAEQSQDMEV
ncbi:RNase P subunit p30-domain-containing protein [Glomus cerebriforme]|uniref:RNase P subunit p30-domain-containing protein n=1 Tax=Glomus cerebriforme TaxID=658196 RepID=A0A397T3L6_9GLOM|nr:RNase P subunit p30-domain-containing protein [Glomus cerebriforme]